MKDKDLKIYMLILQAAQNLIRCAMAGSAIGAKLFILLVIFLQT